MGLDGKYWTVSNNRMIVKPRAISETDLLQVECKVRKKDALREINFGGITRPIIKLDECKVRYEKKRFEKVIFKHKYFSFFKALDFAIKKALGEESKKYVSVIEGEVRTKIKPEHEDVIEEVMDRVTKLEIIIQFNNCWLIGGRIYSSFTLLDFKRVSMKTPGRVIYPKIEEKFTEETIDTRTEEEIKKGLEQYEFYLISVGPGESCRGSPAYVGDGFSVYPDGIWRDRKGNIV